MLLALDTATRQAGLALYDGEVVRAEALWHAGRHHTEWLAPAVDDALRRINARAADLSLLAVTRGPGSFTGLRVAMSLAKGIAAARELPIVALDSLDVAAYPHLGDATLCVTLPAGRGRHAYALYPPQPRADRPAGTDPTIGTLEQIVAACTSETIAGPIRLVGELVQAEREALLEGGEGRIELVPPALAVRRPAALAEMAWARWRRGEQDDLHALEPLYLHLSGGTSP